MSATTVPSPGSIGRWIGMDFSLVRGGLLFQLLRRARMSDDTLGLVHRRIAVAVLVTWAPLLALSALEGNLLGPAPKMPFLEDIGLHARFLIVVPLLILAELIVHRRLKPIVDQFRVRGLVRPEQNECFAQAIGEASKWRNSVAAEVVLLVIVYAIGVLFTLHRYVALGGDAWFGSASRREGLSIAGFWLVFVSLPLFQFLLLRWYFRLFIWGRFLWRVSRLNLDLNATHPDKAGGLGFLAGSLAAFLPIAAAHGALSAGTLANRIFFGGARLTEFKMEVCTEALVLLILFAGPLTTFAPLLSRVKRAGLRDYGALGQTYAREFREKWMSSARPKDEPLLGSGDIQSLADLGNSYAATAQTRLAPISLPGLLNLIVAFLVPILPLFLTMMSMEKLIGRLVGLVF
jgi:hypothetical protein